jgi:hypothetical protein
LTRLPAAAAATDEVRAQAEAMLDVLRSIPLGPDLRIVRDEDS